MAGASENGRKHLGFHGLVLLCSFGAWNLGASEASEMKFSFVVLQRLRNCKCIDPWGKLSDNFCFWPYNVVNFKIKLKFLI
jgi:hypothetical protein